MLRSAYNKRVDPPMISASIPSVSCSRARMSARTGLAIGPDSEIGGDANIVEHVQLQRDDGLQPVVFDDPTADVAFALANRPGLRFYQNGSIWPRCDQVPTYGKTTP
jgi:hypothetical protein